MMWASRSFVVLVLLIIAAQNHAAGQLPDAPSSAIPEQPRPLRSAPEPLPAAGQPPSDSFRGVAETSGPESALPKAAVSEPAVSEPNESVTFRKTVDEVSMVFTVSDKHGRFVKDLAKEDFKILDDNKPPQAVVSFRGEANLPLRVGLLIDASNSVRDRFKFEQESAVEFLNQNIRPRYDQAFVIGFDTTIEVTQDFTDNTEKLTKGVRSLRPGGGTTLYDALYFSCRDKLMKQGTEREPTRRAIILLSDGDDNHSHVTREEAIEMVQRSEAIVYAISTNMSGEKLGGDKVLERIADATGGRPFFPFKIEDVANAFTEIQDELRSQYSLAYRPADFLSDGHYRNISIETQSRKGLRVRARRGYFAPKQ
jgi:Ca-activated chloride channel homolog